MGFSEMVDVNVNSFCRILAKKYVGFWQRVMRGEISPFYGIFVLENAFAKLSTNASTLIVLSFSKVSKYAFLQTSCKSQYKIDKKI